MPNFDDLLKKKSVKKEEQNKEKTNLKSRMFNVVNAAKLLNEDDRKSSPNAKKEALKAKLAKAMEENKVIEDQFAEEIDQDSENEKARLEQEKEARRKKLAEQQQKAVEKLALLDKDKQTENQYNQPIDGSNENVRIVEKVVEKIVEKEVIKEVPVEVIKEVPMEIIKEVPIASLSQPFIEDESINKSESSEKKPNVVLDFFMKTMNGMAYGLFATLIIGTILSAITKIPFIRDNEVLFNFIDQLSKILQYSLGLGIGIGIGYGMGFKDMKLISLGIAGFLANYFCGKSLDFFVLANCKFDQVGDPLTIYITVALVALLMKLIFRKKTSVDIIIIPLFACILSSLISYSASPAIRYVTTAISEFIKVSADLHPLVFGIIIAVVMGMALTAPISSAAIAAVVFTGEPSIAAGAAVIGCCVQMVGFAVQAARDNKIGTIISIGIGTSMLEFKNILKKPIIWLPTILTSAILGPIGTCLLQTKCQGVSAGMGTSGLVGVIGTLDAMNGSELWRTLLSIGLLEIVAPIAFVFLFDFILRKLGLIKKGDLKL